MGSSFPLLWVRAGRWGSEWHSLHGWQLLRPRSFYRSGYCCSCDIFTWRALPAVLAVVCVGPAAITVYLRTLRICRITDYSGRHRWCGRRSNLRHGVSCLFTMITQDNWKSLWGHVGSIGLDCTTVHRSCGVIWLFCQWSIRRHNITGLNILLQFVRTNTLNREESTLRFWQL